MQRPIYFDVSNIQTLHLGLFHSVWPVLFSSEFCSILSVNIEINLTPKLGFFDKFYICHWNLNSIFVYNILKISFLRAEC